MNIEPSNIPEGLPAAEIANRPWLPMMFPLLVIALMVWFGYKNFAEQPTDIIIYFNHDNEIVPNKTELKYGGASIGIVKETFLSEDLRFIGARVEVKKKAAFILQPDTQFWLVKTRVSLSQVTGLETLVSGQYITFQFGETSGKQSLAELRELKPSQFDFYALRNPPLKSSYLGGLNLILSTQSPTSVAQGAPVLYQSVEVGTVEKKVISDDKQSLKIHIYIKDQYKHLIGKQSRFFDVSGLTVNGGLSGIDIKVDSFMSVMMGGIGFTNTKGENEPAVENFSVYPLFTNRKEALKRPTHITVNFASGKGLSIGTELRYKGIKVGEITALSFVGDNNRVEANIDIERERKLIARQDSRFWVVKPKLGLSGSENVETLILGRYIDVIPGTGKAGYHFSALDKPPLEATLHDTFDVTLVANRLGSVKEGVEIFYRGIVIGRVRATRLSQDSRKVLIYVAIDGAYANLIRENTKFWNVSGIGVEFGLFSGAKIETESMDSILRGGITFATPEELPGNQVEEGHAFTLFEEADDEWLNWSPSLAIDVDK